MKTKIIILEMEIIKNYYENNRIIKSCMNQSKLRQPSERRFGRKFSISQQLKPGLNVCVWFKDNH